MQGNVLQIEVINTTKITKVYKSQNIVCCDHALMIGKVPSVTRNLINFDFDSFFFFKT